ncbi:hypothetical protein L218DRAFT_888854 [Marasmius fiardii PR-910]|nr:hypothetical protein L218DRAFT_888854 [Marasmius fiardii PR-910]
MVDKALPPTPSNEDASPSSTGSLLPSNHAPAEHRKDVVERQSKFPFPEPSPLDISSPRRPSTSTAALAHAALGLGLPHVLPHASASSSELNTIVFSSSSSDESLAMVDGISNRRANWRTVSSVERPHQSNSSGNKNRKTRGLSLGPASFLNFGSSEAKGKGKATEMNSDSMISPAKPLVRKSSFWSRRKHSIPTDVPYPSSPPAFQMPASRSDLFVPLPTLTPLSPFNVDLSTSSDRESHDSRGLSRSHSDRIGSEIPWNSPESNIRRDPPPKRRRPSHRPATADPSSPPSFLPDGPKPLTSSPLSTPPPVVDSSFHSQQEQTALRQNTSEFLRPRAQTNPPLLHRLSLNLFSSPPPLPLPPSPSVTRPPTRSLTSKQPIAIPKPHTDEETPQIYLSRLEAAVSKSEIASILASTADSFHVQCLKVYISQFDFREDPLDVALRRLLMDVGLPRETQQIDRVMEAFASRYYESHSGLFTSEDHPYILAFSLIMLHTDAFNKSNKRKMTKADYIKNTRLPGVAPEVLDCFYDNIIFAPFIFVEDPLDVNGQRGLIPDTNPSRLSISNNPASPTSNSGHGSSILGKGNTKVDPYYLISNNLLGPLRVDVETHIPLDEPYSWEGTGGPWDERELLESFAQASVVEVGPDPSRTNTNPAFFSLSVGAGPPSPLVGALGSSGSAERPRSSEVASLRVSKVGILNRKDDILEGGKKASSRRWRPWAVILTGSQLLLFRDPSWANSLFSQQLSLQTFKPDELLSVRDCIAVFDKSYVKHECTFRFVMPDGRHILWGASTEEDMNQWLSRINYASAFKSTGVRMRPMGMSGRDVKLTGVAAATSHLHDLQHTQHGERKVKNWDKDSSRDLMEMLAGDTTRTTPLKSTRRVNISSGVLMESPEAPEIEGADQFIATFNQVKADLAAGRSASSSGLSDDDDGAQLSPESVLNDSHRLPSRSRIILSKMESLSAKTSALQTQLDSDMRLVRSIATLTPFQRTTRERLVATLQSVAKRVMQTRLDLTRSSCHRDVLFRDLVAEAQAWSRGTKMALRVATETLRSQQQQQQRAVGHGDSSELPRMTFSFHEIDPAISSSVSLPSSPYTSRGRPESAAESVQSFHSALDFEPEWTTSGDLEANDLLRTGDKSRTISLDSIRNSSNSSWFGHETPQENQNGVGEMSPRTSEDVKTHERFYTVQEEAEEWNKTRCAHRVSLVRMPSVLEYGKLWTNNSSNENQINE